MIVSHDATIRINDTKKRDGSDSLHELSPELNELIANTPTLTDTDIEELAEANRRLGLPWWKRLFMKPNENGNSRGGE